MFRHEKYVVSSLELQVPAKLNFGDYMVQRLLIYGDTTALVNGVTNESRTFKQLALESINVAVSLVELGVQKGDTIGICSENRPEFFSAFLGTVCAGAVFTAINVNYTEGEFKHVMSISKPKYMFFSPSSYKVFENRLKSYNLKKVILFGAEYSALCARSGSGSESGGEEASRFEARDGQSDVMLLLYSSGTTGLPKGVMLTHLNYLALTNLPSTRDEQKNLTISPWYHALGLANLSYALSRGWTTAFLPKFELNLYYQTIEKYKSTELTLVPPILIAMSKMESKYDLSSVRKIFCGAAPLIKDTIAAVLKRFPNLEGVFQGYGLTETTYGVTLDTGDASLAKPGGVGYITPGSVIKILDVNNGEVLGPNLQGEIRVKGPMVMKGYVNKDLQDDFDDEGFLKTGDIGYYDDDQYFFIVDRMKELIKYKGFQVAPAEIEAVLLQHESVRDAGVIGVEDKNAGEVPLAFVVSQPGRTLTEEELQKFVAEKLSKPKHLRGGVRFVAEIPRNPSGKILRKQLKLIV